MRTIAYLLSLLVVAFIIVTQAKMNHRAVALFVVVAALMTIPLYFGTRDRTKEPSAAEKFLANFWVWLRRGVSLIVGLPMVLAGFYFLVWPDASLENHPWFAKIGTIAIGIFVLYVGVVGQGGDRYAFRDDIELHKENKRRYKWWF